MWKVYLVYPLRYEEQKAWQIKLVSVFLFFYVLIYLGIYFKYLKKTSQQFIDVLYLYTEKET